MGFLGASGCGKSMTLKCIAGIERPDEGRIALDGRVLYDAAADINIPPQKRRVGYLFQNYALFPNMTVEENIGVSLHKNRDLKKEEKKNLIAEQIANLHLKGLEKRYPKQLSGGQQQRVALGRIFAYSPDIILLDEPFSALDAYLKDSLQYELFRILKEMGSSFILVSHNRDEIYKFCNDLILYEDGHTIMSGRTKEIFKNPVKKEAAKLTGCKNITRIKKINDYEALSLDWGVRLRTREKITEKTAYIGIRAHQLLSALEDKEYNTIRIKVIKQLNGPFELQLILKNASCREGSEIWWLLSGNEMDIVKKAEIPDYLYFPPEELMLLES